MTIIPHTRSSRDFFSCLRCSSSANRAASSASLDFELAAHYRDQIAAIERVLERQTVDLKQRKEIFKELLDILIGQKTKVDGAPQDIEAFERWSMISGPFVATMQVMSGHDEREAEAWQRWWNKNKRRNWDDE